MKLFTLKSLKIQTDSGIKETSTIFFVRTVLNNTGQKGVDVTEIEKRLRVLKAFEGKEIDDVVELEDADAQTLLQCTDAHKNWGWVSKDIVEFSKDVKEMPNKT